MSAVRLRSSEGFTQEIIPKIMDTAVIAPRFNDYDLAMMMAERPMERPLEFNSVL